MEDHSGEIVRLVYDLANRMRQSMTKSIGHEGFTFPQGLVVSVLHRFGEMKVSQIGRTIGLSASTTSGIIDRLEKQQMVERVRSQQDKRIVNVRLTEHFLQKHPDFVHSPQEKISQLFTGMLRGSTEQEQQKIIEGLQTLNDLMDRNV